MLKIPKPLPLLKGEITREHIEVIEGFIAARPNPRIIITSKRGQKLPENIIKRAEIASRNLPKIRVGFPPILSEMDPIGKVVTSVTVPITVKSIPTSVFEISNTLFAYTDSTG